jgi:coenzyme PQQ biosynthesis protein PqqD
MNQCPERNPRLAWREIDGEAVIISPEDSHVHELNETASLIWKRADGKHNVEEIAAAVSEEFEVPVAVAATDVRELISTLEQKGLLSIRKPDEVVAGA